MTTVFVSHPPSKLATTSARAPSPRIARQAAQVADVRFNPHDADLSSRELAAAGAGLRRIVIAYRQTAGDEALFRSAAAAQGLRALRHRHPQHRRGRGQPARRAGDAGQRRLHRLGVGVDRGRDDRPGPPHQRLGRRATTPAAAVAPVMGRELRGATLGVIGYGQIGRYLCDLALAWACGAWCTTRSPRTGRAELAQVTMDALLAQSDFVVCLAAATEHREPDGRARLRRHAAAARSSSMPRAATWSTRRAARRARRRHASPAARSTWAARPTRCRRPRWPRTRA
jgi:D-3-phosphoglycerate dehydrogenase